MIGDFILKTASNEAGSVTALKGHLPSKRALRPFGPFVAALKSFTSSIYLKIFFRRIYLKNYIKRNF